MTETRVHPEVLARENRHVLDLVQALLGSISPNMRAVSLELLDDGVRIHVCLAQEDPDDREEIAEIAFEFEALQDRDITIETVTVVGDLAAASGLPGRQVYGRKEPG